MVTLGMVHGMPSMFLWSLVIILSSLLIVESKKATV